MLTIVCGFPDTDNIMILKQMVKLHHKIFLFKFIQKIIVPIAI